MNNLEQQIRETMQDAARSAPLPQGPRAAKRQERRRNSAAVLAAAAAALAVVATGVVLVAQLRSNPPGPDGTAPEVATPSSDTLIGFGDVAMPLPPGWSMGDYMCGKARSDTVAVRPPSIVTACASRRADGVSDIQIDDLNSLLAIEWSEVATDEATLTDGTLALIGTAPSHFWRHATSAGDEGYTTTVVLVPKLDAILVGTSLQPGELNDTMLSAMRMPDDMAAIPMLIGQKPAQASDELDRIGLQAKLEYVPHPSPGRVVASHPREWLVVAAGSAVTLDIGQG